MPGMENLAPERQETNSGLSGSPNFLPVASRRLERLQFLVPHPLGELVAVRQVGVAGSVVTVKPGGTGKPMRVISARFAPLPPNKARTLSQSPPT